jgi:hypothetical protein
MTNRYKARNPVLKTPRLCYIIPHKSGGFLRGWQFAKNLCFQIPVKLLAHNAGFNTLLPVSGLVGDAGIHGAVGFSYGSAFA